MPDGSIYAHEGEFDYDDNEMSRTTATILMRLKFANPERLLVPNGYVTVYSDLAEPPKYPTVQESAVIDLAGGNLGVYVLDEATMTVQTRNIERLNVHDGLAPVAKGLKAGEKVVVAGTRKLRPGCKVRVVEATSKGGK